MSANRGPVESPSGQTVHRTEAGSPTTTSGGLTARPYAIPSLPALLTSAVPHVAHTTPPAPHTAPTSMTPSMPPATLASQLYPQHYSCCRRATGEGCTSGTSGQPSSDDHMGEAGLLTTGRQSHPIGHLGIKLVAGALLRPHRPRRSKLASRHGRRICFLDHQQHMGPYPLPHWLQHQHQQMGFEAQVEL
jgi:hypothetical protein